MFDFYFFQEHREGQLTSMPREVCRSFVKIIAEVLGSPPDLELLTIIFNFLLAVHPPTNTYVCHNPTNFYFSLHIGEYGLCWVLLFPFSFSCWLTFILIFTEWFFCAGNDPNCILGIENSELQDKPNWFLPPGSLNTKKREEACIQKRTINSR